MLRILAVFARFRAELTLVAAVAASLGLLRSEEGVASHALGRVAALAFYPPRILIDRLDEVRTLRRLHESTATELIHANARLAHFAEMDQENARLRALLDFCDAQPVALVAARVIGRQGDVRSGDLVYSVDKGRRDGLEPGDPVLTPQGLVGRIGRSNDLDAVVEPIFSRGIAVSGYTQRTRVAGMLRWRDGRGLTLDNVPLHCEVAMGDSVLTSGLGGLFPRGIPVGQVAGVGLRDYELFLDVGVEPAVDFHRLEEVLVGVGEAEVEPDLAFDESDQTLRLRVGDGS